MVFNKELWQARCKTRMKFKRISYSNLALQLKAGKTTIHRYLNVPYVEMPIDAVLLISRILDVDILEFIVRDEVQLKLF